MVSSSLYSTDNKIRVSEKILSELTFTHLYSEAIFPAGGCVSNGASNNAPSGAESGDFKSCASRLPYEILQAGLTEWVSDSASPPSSHLSFSQTSLSPLSLGWDWIMFSDGALKENFDCPPRSNIMVICERGYDLGEARTDEVLQRIIGQMTWHPDVLKNVSKVSDASIQLVHIAQGREKMQ